MQFEVKNSTDDNLFKSDTRIAALTKEATFS